MMRPTQLHWSVYVCSQHIDFRKGIWSLAVLVESQLILNPFAESLYVFRNRSATSIKLLYWERNGFCLWQKRLEKEKFVWPKPSSSGCVTLTLQQLNWLLDGYDINRMKPHQSIEYQSVL
ncbi:MAG: IS66 family insertion sequence element accessory protein TnpB [Methylococcaceae bacterium]